MSRQNLKLAAVAVVCLLFAWTAPSIAHGVHAKFAHNADKVDGKHAVGAGAGLASARGKLVAHNSQGQLPAKFVPKVNDADKVDGLDSPELQFPTMVPPGRTITGRWGLDVQTGGSGDWGAPISFPAPLPDIPLFNVIAAGGAPTDNCPGSHLVPQAAPGVMCVYVTNRFGFATGPSRHGSSVHGTTLLFSDDVTTGDALAYGTYAYTAPLTAPPAPRKLAPEHNRK